MPGHAAELVENDTGLVGAVACEKLDILDRQIKLVVALIVELEAIVGLARGLDRAETQEASDAVIGMDHEIAHRETRGLGQRVGRFGLARLADEPVAQNVLFADDGETRRLEPGLERQHGDGNQIIGCGNRFRKGLDPNRAVKPMFGQERGQPFPRARTPARHDHDLLRRDQFPRVRHDRIEDISAFGLAFRRKGPALPATEGHDGRPVSFRALERVQGDHMRRRVQKPLPFGLGQEHAVGRDRVIGRRTEGLTL